MAASPSFTITGAAGSLLLRTATAAEALTAAVDNLAGISSVAWSVSGTDESGGTYTLTPSGSYGSTVAWTAGAAGTCGILQCTVNGGVNPQTGNVDPAMTATAKWSVTIGGLHVVAVGEDNEHDPTYGWTGPVNAGIRAASAATGSFSDATFNVYDNGDATKIWKVQLSGFTTGNTRTHTVPDANGTLALLGLAQSWSSDQTFSTSGGKFLLAGSSSGSTELKASAAASGVATLQAGTGTLAFTSDILATFPDNTWRVYDNSDATKLGALDISGLTTGNTRTLLWPDADGRILIDAGVQSITGAKTFADSTLLLAGSSSGASTLKAPAIASTYVHTLPAATATLVGTDTTDALSNKTSYNKVVITAPATSATLTIADGTTLATNVSGPATGQFLRWNGTAWVNVSAPLIVDAQWTKESADAAASTTTAAVRFFTAPETTTITDVYAAPRGTAISDATDYASVVVEHWNSAGVSQGVVATGSTTPSSTGAMANLAKWSLGALANATMAVDDYLTVAITKTGTGRQLPRLQVYCARTTKV